MIKAIQAVAKNTSRSEIGPSTFEEDPAQIITIPKPKPGSYGIPIGDDILMADYASAMSFRVKYWNLGLHKKIQVFRAHQSFPAPMLRHYFVENADNPYALMYVIGRMALSGDVTTTLTQVPPVATKYDSPAARAEAVTRLLKEAQPVDALFSRPIEALPVSRLIRQIDRCQFSHVGIYFGEGYSLDAGQAGVLKTSVRDLAQRSHLALYRLRHPPSDEQRTAVLNFAQAQVGCDYNWVGVIKLFVRKKLGLKSRTPSVSDLLFSDAYQLVCHI